MTDASTDTNTAKPALTQAVIDELVALRVRAKDAASQFTEAVAVQAEKYSMSKGALRRFVCARESGKLLDLNVEADDLAALLARMGFGE